MRSRIARRTLVFVATTLTGIALATAPASATRNSSAPLADTPGATAAIATHATVTTTAAERICSSTIVFGVQYGGERYCNYTVGWNGFSDGSEQVYVVGTDYAVWTRWITAGGTLSRWVSLGGKVKQGDFRSVTMAGTGNVPTVKVIGTTTPSRWYCRTRATSGSWSPWALC